jgi:hypothetical protein
MHRFEPFVATWNGGVLAHLLVPYDRVAQNIGDVFRALCGTTNRWSEGFTDNQFVKVEGPPTCVLCWAAAP